jgi:Fe-S-cluster containining protein
MKDELTQSLHACRKDCGACCIAPSISSPIPGMPGGKPAGVRCIHLSDELLCEIFGQEGRPRVCNNFMLDPLICGSTREEAMKIMGELEGL